MHGQLLFRRWMPWLGILLLAVMVGCGFYFGGAAIGLPLLVGGVTGGIVVLFMNSRK